MLRGEPSPNHAIAQIIAHKSDADLLAGAISLSRCVFARLKRVWVLHAWVNHKGDGEERGSPVTIKLYVKERRPIIWPSESTTFVNCRPQLQFLVYKRQRKFFSSVISTRNGASQSMGLFGSIL
jgi:hypothetical protein